MNDTEEIVIIGDIHLDLLYDSYSDDLSEKTYCKAKDIMNPILEENDLGKYLCNTNLNLLSSAINHIKRVNNNPKVIIIGGDSVAHYMMDINLKNKNKEIFLSTVRRVYEKIRSSFPGALLIPVLGNNDLMTGYNPPSKKHFEEYSFWYNLYFPEGHVDSVTFKEGGYYFIKAFDGRITFIVLNSLYFTTLSDTKNDLMAYTQLFWFNRTLSELSNTSKVLVLSHIGPFPQYFSNKTSFYWYDEYLEVFDDIVFRNKEKILLSLNFHKHFSNFAVIHNPESKLNYFSSLLLPSISPIRETNPAFAVLYYDIIQKMIKDIKTFHLNLKERTNYWGITYSLKDDFGFDNFDPEEFYLLGKFLVFPWRLRRFVTYRIGYQKHDYNDATKKLNELGNLDQSSSLEHLKCNMINFYKKYYNSCIYDFSNGLFHEF